MGTKQRTTVLIDGDILAYKVAFECQTVSPFDPSKKVQSVDREKMRRMINSRINEIADEVNAVDVEVCLTDRTMPVFRMEIDPTYKQHRKAPKPVLLNEAVEFMRSEWTCMSEPRLEADDLMGIFGTRYADTYIIASEDKDMKGVPCRLFNPSHKECGVVSVSQLEADHFWLYQTMVGDAADGYKGARGVGAKSKFVEQLLATTNVDDGWEVVMRAYMLKDTTNAAEEHSVITARLARILRLDEYSFDRQRIKLWMPPRFI